MQEIGRAFVVALGLLAEFNAELLGIVGLSLRVSLSATLVACLIGAPCGVALAIRSFPGRRALILTTHALLGLPPVTVGLFVYLMLSRSGPLGQWGLLFTPAAMILAQALLGIPIVAALVHRGVAPLWQTYRDEFAMDGASSARAGLEFLRMDHGILLTALLAAFGRAIAEVGAILVVGGNIRDYTRTMTTAIALETTKGDLGLALALGLILLGISFAVSALAFGADRLMHRS